MSQLARDDRLNAWFDGSAVCVVAISASGDPLDLSEDEAREFLAKLQLAIDAAQAG
ncbi:MAG: hypothetical protein ACRECQ_18220 [Burkholderiaceae bacterium]